ncbi:MAG TPA: hypothetical protein VK324_15965 [Tepidisphaeraceae bacterium]|nr:hypothetical protein [Tepidisphaeraceae bacterium]
MASEKRIVIGGWALAVVSGVSAVRAEPSAPAAATNLLPNGDFQQVSPAGGLAGWTPDQWLHYKVLDDGDGNRYARSKTDGPDLFPAVPAVARSGRSRSRRHRTR